MSTSRLLVSPWKPIVTFTLLLQKVTRMTSLNEKHHYASQWEALAGTEYQK